MLERHAPPRARPPRRTSYTTDAGVERLPEAGPSRLAGVVTPNIPLERWEEGRERRPEDVNTVIGAAEH